MRRFTTIALISVLLLMIGSTVGAASTSITLDASHRTVSFYIVGSSGESVRSWSASRFEGKDFSWSLTLPKMTENWSANKVSLSGNLELCTMPGFRKGMFDYNLVGEMRELRGSPRSSFEARDGRSNLDIGLNRDHFGMRSLSDDLWQVGKHWGYYNFRHKRPFGTTPSDPTPEPASFLLLGTGLLTLGGMLKRRRM